MGSDPGRAVERLAKACDRSVSSSIGWHEREARMVRCRERIEREKKEERARLVSQLAREMDDKYGNVSDSILLDAKWKHNGRRTGFIDAKPVMFIQLPIAMFLTLAVLDEAMGWDSCAFLFQGMVVVLVGVVAWYLIARHRAFKAGIIADALGEVLAMRAARRGEVD